MKKLILALSAVLLVLTACEEKTQNYTYKNLKFTLPASWTIDPGDEDQGFGIIAYFQDDKVLSNSIFLDITPLDEEEQADWEAAESDVKSAFLEEKVMEMYDSYVLQDDDYTLDDFFGYKVQATDSQGFISFSGKAYDEPYTGTITAYVQDGYLFKAFVSGKDEKNRAKIAEYLNYELL